MVALRAEKRSPTTIDRGWPPRPALTLVPEPALRRGQDRGTVALKCWIGHEADTARGYVVDLSPTGARIGGAGTRVPVGARVILKLQCATGAPPITLRAHVVRYDFSRGVPELAVTFLEAAWSDAFDLARLVDVARGR